MPLATRRSRPSSPAAQPQRALVARSTAKARTFILDVPFAMRTLAGRAGASWSASAKAFVYTGTGLPAALEPFRSEPYSWERLKEDELNGADPVAAPPQRTVALRPHQVAAVQALHAARRAGRTGFLNADDVGLGKTIETWAGILDMEDAGTVLIVCPLAVVAHWRRTIQWIKRPPPRGAEAARRQWWK